MGNDGNTRIALTRLQKTAYYIPTDDGVHTDEFGHVWFSKDIARVIGCELGIMPERSLLDTLKTVVTGYRDAS